VGLSKQITIKIGVKFMIRHNIDATLGFINGTIAIVISIVQGTTTNNRKDKTSFIFWYFRVFKERVSIKFQVMDRDMLENNFHYPYVMVLLFIKDKGLCLQNAIMNIDNSVFSCSQIYVALSRVMFLNGLHLINFDPLSLFVSKEAIIEYNRLK